MVQLIGVVISPDGERVVRKSDQGEVADAENVGRRVGADLLANGAREILEQVYDAPMRDSGV
jgi:hydroxymethylbilane synthase